MKKPKIKQIEEIKFTSCAEAYTYQYLPMLACKKQVKFPEFIIEIDELQKGRESIDLDLKRSALARRQNGPVIIAAACESILFLKGLLGFE